MPMVPLWSMWTEEECNNSQQSAVHMEVMTRRGLPNLISEFSIINEVEGALFYL